jgi:DNA modification methylase
MVLLDEVKRMLTQTQADIQMSVDFSFLPTRRVCQCQPGRLNCLTRQEMLELGSTVIDVKQRHRWQENHPARFIPQVPEKFIKLFSHKGETVLDPFCGSGTTNVVALQLKRSSIGIDVNRRSVEMTYERLRATARNLFADDEAPTHHRVVHGSCLEVLPLIPAGTIDLIVTSPPYFDVVDYEDDHPEQWGNIHDYGEFLKRMEAAFAEMKRVLKPGGWMVVVTQDVFKSYAKCPIHADYIFICRDKLGFEVWSTQVYILNYSTGGRLVYGYPSSYYPKNDHEFIVVFRKPR